MLKLTPRLELPQPSAARFIVPQRDITSPRYAVLINVREQNIALLFGCVALMSAAAGNTRLFGLAVLNTDQQAPGHQELLRAYCRFVSAYAHRAVKEAILTDKRAWGGDALKAVPAKDFGVPLPASDDN